MDAGGSARADPAQMRAAAPTIIPIGVRYFLITKLLSMNAQKHFDGTTAAPQYLPSPVNFYALN
jgi:hypothetical protein